MVKIMYENESFFFLSGSSGSPQVLLKSIFLLMATLTQDLDWEVFASSMRS